MTTTINCTNTSCNWTTDIEETSDTNPNNCPECGGDLTVTGTGLPYPHDGIIEHAGGSLALTQEAWIDTDGTRVYYRAAAVGPDGDEHTVFWTPVEGYEDMEDASDHCDWTRYTVDCK